MKENGNPFPRVKVIKHRGEPQSAQLPNGEWVERRESVALPHLHHEGDWMTVKVAPYSDHFVYLVPAFEREIMGNKRKGDRWRYFSFCTCGSFGQLVGSKAYSAFGSADGMMLVCQVHTNTGRHADGTRG